MILDVTPEVESSLKWLQVNASAVLDTVKSHWESTSEKRLQIMKQEKCTLNKIFENWKVLQQPEAHSLVVSDFDSMKLAKKIVNDETWLAFIKSIFRITNQSNKNETAKRLNKILDTPDLPSSNLNFLYFL